MTTQKHHSRISGHTADHRKNQIVFVSIEMTVPPRDIIEFAAVVMDKYGFYELESFSTLVKSDKLSADSVSINGINEKMLEHAPTFETVASQIATLIEGRIVAGYAIGADLPYLKKCFEAIKRAPPTEHAVFDIAPLLKDKFGGRVQETKLDTLGHFFGLGGKKNRAVEDCRLSISVLKNAALGLFLEGSLPQIFPAPSYSAAAVNARVKAAAADAKTPRQAPAPSPTAAVPPVEEDAPKRKKPKQHDTPSNGPQASPAAPAKSADTQFQQEIFAFQPQPQPAAAPAPQTTPAPQPAKVRPSPIQRPNPTHNAVPPLAQQQQPAQATIFGQLSQPTATPKAWGAASPAAGSAVKPANLLLSPTASAPITTSTTPAAANGHKTEAKAAAAPSPSPASPMPALGTAAAVAAATANSKKKSWSSITEIAEKVKTPTAGGPTTPGGTSIAAVTPRTVATPTAKKATTPSAAAAANGDGGWQQAKSKPKREGAPTPTSAGSAASPTAADADENGDGWQTADSRKAKRAQAAKEAMLNAPRDAVGQARDKAAAKIKSGTGGSRPSLDADAVAYLEDAIAKKKKIWIMYFNPVAGTKPRHILPLGWEKKPALLKAMVEGETEPAYFTTRKIVEIRDQNTFDTPPAPMGEQ